MGLHRKRCLLQTGLAATLCFGILTGAHGAEIKISDLTIPDKHGGIILENHSVHDGKLYYVSGENLFSLDLTNGATRRLRHNYDGGVRSIIVNNPDVVTLTVDAGKTEISWFGSLFQWGYDRSRTIMAGVVCSFKTMTCTDAVKGNFYIADFQEFKDGYIYAKTEWKHYNYQTDVPNPLLSKIVTLKEKSREYGIGSRGVVNLYIYNNQNIYLDCAEKLLKIYVNGRSLLIAGRYIREFFPDGRLKLIDENYFTDTYVEDSDKLGTRLINASQSMKTNGTIWVISYGAADGEFGSIYGRGGEFYKLLTPTVPFFFNDRLSYLDRNGHIRAISGKLCFNSKYCE